jgi:flagellin
MSRINTNISSLIAQRVLGQNNQGLSKSLERLSTGYRINRGGDGPAALIASERLRSEKAQISAAISNSERADQLLNVAEGGLQEINSLMIELQTLVSEAGSEAGLSDDEKRANQFQIDSIIGTIDRIASTTSFSGTKLLNGNYEFQVSNVAATVSSYQVNGAKMSEGSTLAVEALVAQSAQHGSLFMDFTAAAMSTGANDATSVLSFEVAGAKGSREFTFASGTAVANIQTSINAFKDVTGVSASLTGNVINLQSTDYGDENFVQVSFTDIVATQVGTIASANAQNEDTNSGATANFTAMTAPVRDLGQDIAGSINGVAAEGRGRTLAVNNDALDVAITLTGAGSQALGAVSALTIADSGAKFNLGPSVDLTNQVRVGIKNIVSRNLGATEDSSGTVRYLDDIGSGRTANVTDGDLALAQSIVNGAIDEVSKLRGRLGAVQKNVVGSTIRALGVAYENTSAAESAIRDTDFAEETSNLTRNQILVQASTSALSIANAQSQNVLQLLG